VSWLKYLWATLIGFVVTVTFATSSATLILWLDLSRYVERSCANNPMTTCSAWAEIGYGIQIITVCLFIGLFVGIFVGTTVGVHVVKTQNRPLPISHPATRPGNRPLPTTQTRTYCELRTNRVHYFHCQLSQASGGGRTFRALRIPVIRSARNECSTSSRRRIVHG